MRWPSQVCGLNLCTGLVCLRGVVPHVAKEGKKGQNSDPVDRRKKKKESLTFQVNRGKN